eukprot:SAG31_NODE_8751_length_1394_cov_1.816988_1_plen_106_part_00
MPASWAVSAGELLSPAEAAELVELQLAPMETQLVDGRPKMVELQLAPMDAHNAALLDCVHPRAHQDPDPVRAYLEKYLEISRTQHLEALAHYAQCEHFFRSSVAL